MGFAFKTFFVLIALINTLLLMIIAFNSCDIEGHVSSIKSDVSSIELRR
jgi:hypothetical protein